MRRSVRLERDRVGKKSKGVLSWSVRVCEGVKVCKQLVQGVLRLYLKKINKIDLLCSLLVPLS